MTTVKQLIELLKRYNQDCYITNEQNQPFIHIVSTVDGDTILSTVKPIGLCNRTGSYVYPSVIKGYVGFCPELDEDLYEDEFSRDMSEMREQ